MGLLERQTRSHDVASHAAQRKHGSPRAAVHGGVHTHRCVPRGVAARAPRRGRRAARPARRTAGRSARSQAAPHHKHHRSAQAARRTRCRSGPEVDSPAGTWRIAWPPPPNFRGSRRPACEESRFGKAASRRRASPTGRLATRTIRHRLPPRRRAAPAARAAPRPRPCPSACSGHRRSGWRRARRRRRAAGAACRG